MLSKIHEKRSNHEREQRSGVHETAVRVESPAAGGAWPRQTVEDDVSASASPGQDGVDENDDDDDDSDEQQTSTGTSSPDGGAENRTAVVVVAAGGSSPAGGAARPRPRPRPQPDTCARRRRTDRGRPATEDNTNR